MSWVHQLDKKRGSQPRCVLLMDGNADDVAKRLSQVVSLPYVCFTATDEWMPKGKPRQHSDGSWDKSPAAEARLDRDTLLEDKEKSALKSWWLEVYSGANTPNWDIASTCLINEKPGLLLVEAKAHWNELSTSGKAKPTTDNGWLNHEKIQVAIAEASEALERSTNFRWNLSRDSHYQLSNRFAWAWKLASMGIPVVLVYLGFLNATEMSDQSPVFSSQDGWEDAVRQHSQAILDDSIWGSRIEVDGVPIIPLIRSVYQHFDQRAEV